MKNTTLLAAMLLLVSSAAFAQAGTQTHWLSFVIQPESRAGSSTSWDRGQRLEVSKRVGAETRSGQPAGLIQFKPEDKEVRLTFSAFTLDGAWFAPSEIAVEYQEDGRVIGPIRALPGAGANDYFQLSLRFREKTERSVLTVWAIGRASGQFVKDTVNTVLMWGSGGQAQASDVQVSYLDSYNTTTTAKTPYSSGAVSSYSTYQGRIEQSTTGTYTIQLGAYGVIPDSRQFAAAAAYGDVYSRRIGGLYHVRVGQYNDLGQARQALQSLRSSYPEAFLVLDDLAAAPAATSTYQAPAYQTPAYSQPAQYDVGASRLTAKGTVTSAYALPAGTTGYALQLASYNDEFNARTFVDGLRQRGLSDVYLWQKDGKNRVVLGPFSDKGGATNYLATLKRQYLLDGIVVYLKD